jgi:lipoyl synthase
MARANWWFTRNDFGLEGIRRPPFTGIWIGNRKIAAIGIAVRRSITFHGLALNVNTDLSYFKRIIPCGLDWADVTSMARELGKEQSTKRVKGRFLQHFADIFGYTDAKEGDMVGDKLTREGGIQNGLRSSAQLETRDSELETAR